MFAYFFVRRIFGNAGVNARLWKVPIKFVTYFG